jgi:(p)ppGpp synthase/HD superfamily hydrolase
MYTYKIEQAIKATAVLHLDQVRKGVANLPFVTHPMSVMTILRDYTEDENTLVAALLHDTVEDTDYTLDEMKEDFGKEVADLVSTITEPCYSGERKLTWLEVKQAYAKQIKNGSKEAAMISAADKTHNFRTMIEDYYEHHEEFIRDFGPNLDNRLEAYQNISNAINNRLSDGIVHEFNQTFVAYKKFILDVKETYTKRHT